MLEIKSKSGIAVKKGCVVGACVVDRGYTGEIFVNLWNFSNMGAQFNPGDKVAQAVFVKINTDIEFVETDNIYDDETSLARRLKGCALPWECNIGGSRQDNNHPCHKNT
jgi:dUTPase